MDPVRRIVAPEAAWISVLGAVPMAFAIVLLFSAATKRIGQEAARRRWLGGAGVVLFTLLSIQAIRGVFAVQSLGPVALALLRYCGFPIVIFALRRLGVAGLPLIGRFSRVYLAAAAVNGLVISAGFLGLSPKFLRGVTFVPWVRSAVGGHLQLPSGFLRGPTLAGWHGVSAIALRLSVLAITGRSPGVSEILGLGLAGLGALLTGRRKVFGVFVLVAFVTAVWLLARLLRRKAGVLIAYWLLCAITLLVVGGQPLGSPIDAGAGSVSSVRQRYVEFYGTTIRDLPGRIISLTKGNVVAVLDVTGAFGLGLGTAGLGQQHYQPRVNVDLGRVPPEGGLGIIAGEMGYPGLFLAVLICGMAVSALVKIWVRLVFGRCAQGTLAALPPLVLSVNVLVFLLAGSIYGDPSVLSVVALFVAIMPPRAECAGRVRWFLGRTPRKDGFE